MIDTKKIKARMILMGIKQRDVADAWKCATTTASQKLNRKRPISLAEADTLAHLLNLNQEEYYEYFFEGKIA